MLQDKKQTIIIIISLVLCAMTISAYCLWWYWSSKLVIKSTAGNISQGTFAYIRFIYYPNQPKAQIYKNIQENMAIGYLADRLGLINDPYYSKFLAISRRSRKQRAAIQWLKHKKKTKNIDINLTFKEFDIDSDPHKATESIQSCIQREKHGFRLKCHDVVLGRIKNASLKLSMIKPLLTPDEWQQFLAFLPLPMENAYKSYLKRFLYHVVHQEMVEFFSPALEELEQVDHDQVANRYISVKYGMTHEGIYPTRRLSLDFPDTVLFNHFFAIKHRFLPVQTVQVQYSVFETMDMAEMVYKKLHEGESLVSLAKLYAINDHFIQTAYPHKLSGYGVNGMPSHPEQRAIIDNYLLNAARKNNLLPQPHPLDRGVLVAQLSNLQRQESALKYRDYQFAVKRDLTLKILKEKFRIDVEDAIDEIQWQCVDNKDAILICEKRI